MPQLEVFGLSLTVNGNQILPPNLPHLTIVHWRRATHVRNRATFDVELNIGADSHLEMVLEFTTRAGANGVLRPTDGAQPVPRRLRLRSDAVTHPVNAPLVLEVGALAFVAPVAPPNALIGVGGELVIHLTRTSRRWFGGAETCGFTVDYGAAGARLDLAAPELRLDTGFLSAETGVHLDLSPTHEMTVFVRPHASRAVDMPVGGAAPLTFTFEPTSKDELALHTELARAGTEVGEGNPVIAAAGLTGYCLQATFESSGAAYPRLFRLSSKPLAAAQQLLTHFHQNAHNERTSWETSDDIALHLRSADGPAQPSSLLIAPTGRNGIQLRRQQPEPLHGLVSQTVFNIPARVTLRCDLHDAGPRLSGVEPDITSTATLPYVTHSGASRLRTPLPGEAYTDSGSSDVERLDFAGRGGSLPLQPILQIRAEAAKRTIFLQQLNLSWQGHSYPLATTIHETAFEQGPEMGAGPVSPVEVFTDKAITFKQMGEPMLVDSNRVLISRHNMVRKFGIAEVNSLKEPDSDPDYIVISDIDDLQALSRRYLEPGRREFKLNGDPRSSDGRPLGIIKLSDVYSLEQIFQRERLPTTFSDEPRLDMFAHVLDAMVKERAWRGVILFDLPVDYSEFLLLQALTTDELRLRYIAFTARHNLDQPDPNEHDISLSGRIVWSNRSLVYETKLTDTEVRLRVERVEAAWLDSRLSYFRAEARVYFNGAFGLEFDRLKPPPALKIDGSYDQEVFRFVGELSRPLPILDPGNGFGPFKQVWIKAAEVVESPKGVSIDLDGDIELRSLSWGQGDWIDSPPDRFIRFRKLALQLPRLETNMPRGFRWLKIGYPSIEIDLGQNHFRLFSLEALQLKLKSLGISWDNEFDWGSLVPIFGGFTSQAAKFTFLLTLRLHLMKLPELVGGSLKDLIFDFVVGLRSVDGYWSPDNFKVALSALGFDHLSLRLMRFLEVHADHVLLERKTLPDGTSVSWFSLGNVEVRILGRTVVRGLTAAIFTTTDGQRGFFAFLANSYSNGLLDVDWVLIGQNISIVDDLAKALTRVGPEGDAAGVRQLISDNSTPDRFLPTYGTGRQAIGEWIFAAGFTVAGRMFSGKFLFQDRRYYGIAIKGDLLKEWFGYDLELSVLYTKRPRPEEDSFYISFTVPAVTVGTVRFTGGVVALEIAMNGSLMVDIGFPWRGEHGMRAWGRTLGAIVTPFQGSGGFYIAKRSAVTQLNGQLLRLSAGYALQAGLGACFGGGIFTVWVRAGITVVLEGDALLRGNDLVGLRISGAIGILVEGGGELNWWIVSARVAVIATAEAMTTLLYGLDPETLQPFPDGNRMRIRIDFNLCARASASACIGSGWFKYCREISVSVGMPFQHTITVG